jgi:hypothetical protein
MQVIATDKKILNEALSLKALHEEGVKKANALIQLITGGVSTPSTNQKKQRSTIVNQRNIFIKSKTIKHANT